MSGLQCSEMVRARICIFIFKSTSCAEVGVSSVHEDLICLDHCALFWNGCGTTSLYKQFSRNACGEMCTVICVAEVALTRLAGCTSVLMLCTASGAKMAFALFLLCCGFHSCVIFYLYMFITICFMWRCFQLMYWICLWPKQCHVHFKCFFGSIFRFGFRHSIYVQWLLWWFKNGLLLWCRKWSTNLIHVCALVMIL